MAIFRISKSEAKRLGIEMPKGRSKYGSTATVVDGIRFSSKKEAKRYGELKLLQERGEVLWFIMQAPFRLPGGTVYRADFLVVWSDVLHKHVTVEDVKGFKTPIYRLKKREVEHQYGITITEI